MKRTLSVLVDRLTDPLIAATSVIPWGAPVPSFGSLSRSAVATVGLNPSDREFVDSKGRELNGEYRRFHTLNSLGITAWSEATDNHLRLIASSCQNYFSRNPYDTWFKVLDHLIYGTDTSYYKKDSHACHLDIVPYATSRKWSELSTQERTHLLEASGDALGLLLQKSPVRLLVLNGISVVEALQAVSGVAFEKEEMIDWRLPRKSRNDVKGYSYSGCVTEIAGIKLKRDVRVLGFNHNLQSSFGVTNKVKGSMQAWVRKSFNGSGQ